MWTIDGPQGSEALKVKYEIVPFTRGRGLDLGCGPAKPYAHFIGLDSNADKKLFGIEAKPDILVDTCETLDFKDRCMDFVFSSHLLEHIVDFKAALAEWWRVIKVGGHLVLYLPDRDLYPNIGQNGSNPDHKHDFTARDIIDAMIGNTQVNGFDVIINEKRDQGIEYSFLLVFRKREDFQFVDEPPPRHPKTVCVVRYGGFGDMLQSAAILPELKRQGYHVTFMTTPQGKEILKEDPHIDEWFLQDTDQVPNGELGPYWHTWRKRFDKWVNLSESVERILLVIPGTTVHNWPQSARHKFLDRNYGEQVANIAEVPFRPEGRFYPTPEEEAWAKKFVADAKGFIVLWVLAGSSVHKCTPHQDAIIAKLMLAAPDIQVVLSGDEACQILEVGWENEPRVHLRSGKLAIRESLAVAREVGCVVGPETGVLNSVAYEPVPKVVFLSHSSKENLTKHWKQTTSLAPVSGSTPCYPCHQLHYTSEWCDFDQEIGVARCQINTDPEQAFQAIWRAYTGSKAANRRPAILNRLLKAVS